jgi:DNA polymerase-3 subunit epsilon
VLLPHLKDEKFVFLDIETTGMRTYEDRITEVGALVYETGKLVKSFSTLINPDRYIPSWITDITGITNDMVKKSPRFEDIAEELMDLLGDNIFVAHNVSFDYRFIQAEFANLQKLYNAHQLCTVKLSRNLYPNERGHNLDYVMERCGIECGARHRAFEDAEVLLKFYETAKKIFPEEVFKKALDKSLKKIEMLRTDTIF